MKTKKIIAVVLSAAMLTSLASCSLAGGSKLQKKYADALDAIGYKEADGDDIEDDFDELCEDGFYMTTNNKKDIEDFCSEFTYLDEDDVKSLVVGIKSTENGGMFIVLSADFTDEDAAEDFFDEMKDEFGGVAESYEGFDDYVKFEENDDDDVYQLAMAMDYEDYLEMEEYLDLKVDGKTATMILVLASDDEIKEIVGDMEDFYEEIDEDSPKDLL
ncbi:MAG: hypothetical protein MJ093_07715 [Saccharofermentans sp.]|nr:hypothetical protein [Saccharofermentans sp.]